MQRKLPGGRGTGCAEYIPLSLRQILLQPGVNLNPPIYGGSVCAFATIACELRQVRKEATAASYSGAGVSLAELPPSFQIKSTSRQAAIHGALSGPAIHGRSAGNCSCNSCTSAVLGGRSAAHALSDDNA